MPTEQAWPDLGKVAKQIGEQILWYAEALGTFGLGVLRIEQDVHPRGVELQMTRDGEHCNAAPADRPNTVEGDDEPVAIIKISLLTGRRQRGRFLHHLDAEIEGVPGWEQSIEPVQRLSTARKPRFRRG